MSRAREPLDFVTWGDRARRIAAAQGAESGAGEWLLRARLCELVRLTEEAPDFVLDAFRSLTEEELRAEAEPIAERILRGDLGWDVPDLVAAKVMRELGGRIRALDSVLADQTDPVAPVDLEARWGVPGGGFLIPRGAPRWRPRGTLTGQSFSKRGLVRHRRLPERISTRRVRLVRAKSGLQAPGPVDTLVFGAALFPELGLIWVADDATRRFTVTGLKGSGREAALDDHLAAAHSARCFAAVWPELTLDPPAQARLRASLVDGALDRDWTLPLVVAGSWHETRPDGRKVNACRVLNGFGEELLVYEKRMPFQIGGLTEDIASGEELPVLILDDLAISFAVCLDFAHGANNAYAGLDVDVMLVPSFGDVTTANGHLRTARAMRLNFSTCALVVQQALTKTPEAIGYLLPPLGDVDAETGASLASLEPWSAFGEGDKRNET